MPKNGCLNFLIGCLITELSEWSLLSLNGMNAFKREVVGGFAMYLKSFVFHRLRTKEGLYYY